MFLIALVSCMPKRLPDYSEPISITFTDDGEIDLNELYEIVGRPSGLQSGQSASLLNLEFTYDSVGNILTITDQLNSSQVQTFGYDALNRLISASTNGVGQGQYSQSYSYDPATGNLASKSDVGAYTYSSAKPHAVTSAGPSAYTYDANGNMISRNGQPISYDAENHLTAFAGKTYLYDGDGNRVAEINADGTATIFIGNYFEGAYPEPEPPPQPPQPPQPLKFYMPFVSNAEEATELFEPITARMGTLYFYADGQRIAMKKDGVVSYIYGDQLGSVSAVADGNRNLISKTLYHPWGTPRYSDGISPTDYGYTGQMKEGDIYFYNARWYDPQLGRFMQADTFVPTVQGTQGFDRYAYINNNPVNGTDPSGHWRTPGNINLMMTDGPGFDRFRAFISEVEQAVNEYSGNNDLEGMATVLDITAYYYPNYDEFFNMANRVFLGIGPDARKNSLYNGRFNIKYEIVATFSDTKFHEDYRDGGNQPHHLWAYIANSEGLGSATALGANLFHEVLQSFGEDFTGQGASWQDYRLSIDGIELGSTIKRENFDASTIGNLVRKRFGPSGGGSGDYWRSFQDGFPLWGER